MSIPLDKIVVKHMFRFAAAKMRALYAPIMSEMKVRDNCMWYWHPKHNLMLHVLQTGIWDEYNEYITLCNHKEHTREIFEKLVTEFNILKMEPIEVSWNGQYFVVNNGAHRLAILMHKGIIMDSIPIYWLKNNGKIIEKWDANSIDIPEEVIKQVSSLLGSTVGYSFSNGWNNRTQHGYHSFTIKNMNLIGQRGCVKRLEKMKSVYDFKGKKVVDLGCNTGGMIMHLETSAKGVGVDYDGKCIEVARKVSTLLKDYVPPCEFYQMNLERTNEVRELMERETPDVVFLLSMGSWVNWEPLYKTVTGLCNRVFLEINNNHEGQPQIDFFVSEGWNMVEVSGSSDDDTTGNHNRRLFFMSK